MSIEATNEVDAVGIDEATDETVLTIFDSLDWNDTGDHLYLLQEKLNAYLGFIESGELVSAYPDSAGRSTRIDLLLRFTPPPVAVASFEKIGAITKEYGAPFRWEVASA